MANRRGAKLNSMREFGTGYLKIGDQLAKEEACRLRIGLRVDVMEQDFPVRRFTQWQRMVALAFGGRSEGMARKSSQCSPQRCVGCVQAFPRRRQVSTACILDIGMAGLLPGVPADALRLRRA